MAHGYIGDGYGIDGGTDRDRDDDRDSNDRSERGERNRSGRQWPDDDRRSDRAWRSEGDERWPENRWPEQRGRADSYNRQAEDWSGQHRRSADPDDHYRSWRERHMSELDRDYADYCREREEAFHNEFDTWRRQRHASYEPLRTGMTNTGLSHDPSGEVQATTEGTPDQSGRDPTGDATLGTNSEDNSSLRRRSRAT